MARERKDQNEYVSILADGSFRLSVPEGTEGAVVREYETSEGMKATKNELVLQAISGKVTKVDFVTTNYGTLLQITVSDEGQDLIISTGTSSNFGTDLMKRLPSFDFSKNYRFAPYSFTNDDGKNVRGVSIIEGLTFVKDASKIPNFFWDAKKEKVLHDFPQPKGDTKKYTKNRWKSFFGDVEDFLIEYIKDNVIEAIQKAVGNNVPLEDEKF